uniref:Uncharacterized protein n=1 Tax=Theropithecus gelada TaxID=9565 RepID=A0A8D2EMA6_THEGE
MGSLTSNAAWGSSSIRASEKLWKNLSGKQRLQHGSLGKKNTHLWDVAVPFFRFHYLIRGCVVASGSRGPDDAWIPAIFGLGLTGSHSALIAAKSLLVPGATRQAAPQPRISLVGFPDQEGKPFPSEGTEGRKVA